MAAKLTRDIAIVGGGPGGLVAAARLAADGFDAVLFEEHPDIGTPVHCTGVLAHEAMAELTLPRSAVLNTLRTVRFYSPAGLDISYTTPDTEAIVIDRLAFDRAIAADAVAAGADVRRGARVTAIRVESDCAEVDIDGGATVRARAVILACGASYGFQRRLGLGMPAVYLNSAQLELPARRGGDVELFFGSTTAPRGFAWAVPVTRPDGHFVRIGLMCQGDASEHFARAAARLAPSWGVPPGSYAQAPRRRLLPLAPIQRTFADRLLAVGDAAGLVKPTTGGGIYYSIVSAGLAAEVLGGCLRRGRLDAASLAEYQTRWRARLMPEFRAQLAMRMLAQRLDDREIDALFELAQTDGVMPIVRRTARFNRHRELIVALFRHPPARRILFRRLVG
jgi:geranylgeranyl reductase family protein